MLPGDWDLAHAIRLGIRPFAELGANSEALSGSQVDSSCSGRAIFESAPVAMLQSPFLHQCARNGFLTPYPPSDTLSALRPRQAVIQCRFAGGNPVSVRLFGQE
jgi:hypothetical protein